MTDTKLRNAAEELARVAVETAQTSSLAVSRELLAVSEKTATSAAATSADVAAIKEALSGSQEQWKTLQEKCSSLESKLGELKNEVASRNRLQMLQGVYTLVHIGNFTCYSSTSVASNSQDLVKNIISNALRGTGTYVDGYSLNVRYYNKDNADTQKFQDALSNQVHGITGIKPLFVTDNTGELIIRIP